MTIPRRMPSLLHWWFCNVRKAPNTWITLPHAIYIARQDWDAFLSGDHLDTWDHELVHWERMRNRPWLSRWWWAIHYLLSTKMAYEEEILAMREELKHHPNDQAYVAWLVWNLRNTYGFTVPEEKIFRDLTSPEIGPN